MTRMTLTEDVYNRLKDKIVTFQLAPGTPLHEVAIAEELQVSRTPVREALRILEAEGLVDIEPRRGARVAVISRQLIMDAYQAREWVEPIAAAQAALHIDKVTLAQLEEAVSEMPADPRTHEQASIALEADRQFHDLISLACGNQLIQTLLKDARAITQRAAYFVPPGRFQQSREEHHAIYEAIRDGDSEVAEEMMREHIVHARNRMVGYG